MSKVFDNPLNDKALKRCNILASQHHSYIELILLTAQSAAFISEKRDRHNTNTNSQSVSFAQVTSSTKVYQNNCEIEHGIAQSTEF